MPLRTIHHLSGGADTCQHHSCTPGVGPTSPGCLVATVLLLPLFCTRVGSLRPLIQEWVVNVALQAVGVLGIERVPAGRPN